MKKTLSMGAFTELDEREVMETEGGNILYWCAAAIVAVPVAAVCVVETIKTNNAENAAESKCKDYYNYVKNNSATVPVSAIKIADQYAGEYGWTRLA